MEGSLNKCVLMTAGKVEGVWTTADSGKVLEYLNQKFESVVLIPFFGQFFKSLGYDLSKRRLSLPDDGVDCVGCERNPGSVPISGNFRWRIFLCGTFLRIITLLSVIRDGNAFEYNYVLTTKMYRPSCLGRSFFAAVLDTQDLFNAVSHHA